VAVAAPRLAVIRTELSWRVYILFSGLNFFRPFFISGIDDKAYRSSEVFDPLHNDILDQLHVHLSRDCRLICKVCFCD